MYRLKKRSIVLMIVTIFLLTVTAAPALAQQKNPGSEPDPEIVIADLILVRPLGFIATVFGAALFVVTLPFTVFGGEENTNMVIEKIIKEPARFTFERPVGQFEDTGLPGFE